jgi:SAM-dependent methyltransferase
MAAEVQEHHKPAAEMWSKGGRGYDDVSFAISDALAHAAQRLSPKPGERVLDVATGTGWTARNAARWGAHVVGVDIADGLLEAAKALAADVEPKIEFELGDAEALPFEDASFDRVISTFGVMFAGDQKRAADELARVTKPGGRLVLATWVPGGSVEEFFGVLARHQPEPPPDGPSPILWGDPDHVRGLLGHAFDLKFEPGRNHNYFDTVDDVWEWYERGFGPVRTLNEHLDEAGRAALRADVDAYHAKYAGDAGVHIERDYLIVMGRRK